MLKETYNAALAMQTAARTMLRLAESDPDKSVSPALLGAKESLKKTLKYADSVVRMGQEGGWNEEISITLPNTVL